MPRKSTTRKSTTSITIGGETRSLSEWSRLAGLDPKIIRSRLSYGWYPYEAVCLTGTISTTGKPGRRVARARGMAIGTVRKRCPWAVRVVKVESVVLAIESYEDCPELAPVYDMRNIVVQGAEFKG